jgi:hypothetical protein
MRGVSWGFFAFLALPAALLTPGPAFALGEQYGRISGRVLDDQGLGIPDVSVTLTSFALLGGPRRLTTAKDGAFTFNNLPPGSYNLLAEKPGLQTLEWRRVIVSVGKTAAPSFIMEVSSGVELPLEADTAASQPLFFEPAALPLPLSFLEAVGVSSHDEAILMTISCPMAEPLPLGALEPTKGTQAAVIDASFTQSLPGGQRALPVIAKVPGVGADGRSLRGSVRGTRFLIDGVEVR